MFCRFIYARYASGFVASGTILFHRLAAILIVSFISQFILIYPLSGLWRFYNIYPLNMIKGKLCALAPIAQNEFQNENNGFAWKHKLIIITMMLLFVMVTLYFYKSSKKQTKRHFIPKYPRNLLTIGQHTSYTVALLVSIILDQVSNQCIELFYFDLSVRNAFIIWWIEQVFYFIVIHVFFPLFIIILASRKLENFNGLRSKRFPGQEGPRPLLILSRDSQTVTPRPVASTATPVIVVVSCQD